MSPQARQIKRYGESCRARGEAVPTVIIRDRDVAEAILIESSAWYLWSSRQVPDEEKHRRTHRGHEAIGYIAGVKVCTPYSVW